MFGKESSKPQSRIDCLIGSGTEITGNITFSGGLRVDGHIRGNIIACDDKPSTVVLSEKARVDGEIRVSHVVVNGTVTGPIVSAEYVELQPKAVVTGDVSYRKIEIHLGAILQGRLLHEDDLRSEKVVPFKPAVVE
ncbi:MAG: polymer-forming cytoskeletal protein [Proteobacteria bacterium]|nr:polymer-forming cytoskeletal protein [Burkholderiales bacterium]